MFERFMGELRPDRNTRILDVGVTSDTSQAESNYFEKLYPYPDRITCVGTEDGAHLEREYPGLKYIKVRTGEPLPFAAREFDIVFSNAVIEHVGSRAEQAAFARELCRVGNAIFVTTPNRWFPVEHHTGLPLLHWLPSKAFRKLIKSSRYRYWSDEKNLNLLTTREFGSLFPPGAQMRVDRVRVFGITSNLMAYGTMLNKNGSE